MALPTALQGKLLDFGGRRFRTTELGVEDVTGQKVSGEVSAIQKGEFESLERGEVFAGGGLQTRFAPDFEQTFGTVAAQEAGQPFTPQTTETTFDQDFRTQTGRFPTNEERTAGGAQVPTAQTPGFQEFVPQVPEQAVQSRFAQPTLPTAPNIVPHPSAPAGFGIDLSTGKFARLPRAGEPKAEEPTDDALGVGNLGQVPTSEFQTAPTETTPFDVGGLGLTPTAQQAQGFSQQAQQATTGLLGEAKFRREEEERLGLPALSATQRDLETRLNTLQREAASIRPSLEEGAVGRGLTTTILGRQEQGLLRQNAIQALSVATLLEASRGNITTAQDLADRSVAAKFDPIREQQQVALTNLAIAKDSPQFSAEEKKQAAQMEATLNAQKVLLESAVDRQDTINKIAIEVAKNNPDIPTNILNQIINADSDVEAARLASPFLKASSLAGLSEAQLKQFNTIAGNIKTDPDIKGFIDIRDSFNRVAASAQDPSPAGDLALIFNYMKILDPGSVVRESEFATAQNTGSVPTRIWATYNKVLNGQKLTSGQRGDFTSRAEKLFTQKLTSHRDAVAFFEKQADAFGLPKDLLIRDFVGISDEPINLPAGGGEDTGQQPSVNRIAPPTFDFSSFNFNLGQ